MQALPRALYRFGGVLVRPRETVRSLRDDEGIYDGIWLGLLYLLCVGTLDVMSGVATARATANFSGFLMMVASLGRVLVVPIVVLVACETVLGRTRSHRRGLMLVPLLLVVAAGHELAVHGLVLRDFVPEIIGGVLSIALAWRVREAVSPLEEPA